MKIIHEIRDLLEDRNIRLLNKENQKKIANLKKYTHVKPIAFEAIPSGILKYFSPLNGPPGSYAYTLGDFNLHMRDGRDTINFADDTREVRLPSGKIFYASSEIILYADILKLMLHDARWALALCLPLIFLLVFLDFGSIKHTLLVLTPLIMGVMLMLVLLYSFGGKINFFSIIVLPLIIGLGIDDGIHFLHRYLREGDGSVTKTLRTTGKAIAMTSITTFIGFFGLSFSHYTGLKSIGYLAMAGIFGCFITTVLILPVLIEFFEHRKIKPEFSRKSYGLSLARSIPGTSLPCDLDA